MHHRWDGEGEAASINIMREGKKKKAISIINGKIAVYRKGRKKNNYIYHIIIIII